MDWIDLIAKVGFPIVAYLLIYIDLRRLVLENTNITRALYYYLKGGQEHGTNK